MKATMSALTADELSSYRESHAHQSAEWLAANAEISRRITAQPARPNRRMAKTTKLVAIALALTTTLTACQHTSAQRSDSIIKVYENEDLSGDTGTAYGDVYDLPLSAVIVSKSAGWVCYANDRAGIDTRQLYTDCAKFVAAGGRFSR